MYTLILRRSGHTAQPREPVEFDSGDEELHVGDVVDVDGRAWRLIDEQIFPADSAPDIRTFTAEPV